MKIYCDISLEDFEYWGGAVDTAKRISEAGKWNVLEAILVDLYDGVMKDTQLNDLLWMDSETVYKWLGISDEDEEDEEEYKSPEDCADFDEFCSQFERCALCPYNGEEDCESKFVMENEAIIPF